MLSEYRHEYKYMINHMQKEILNMKLTGVLELDIHARKTNGYTIHSLYFDDLKNSCYYENEDGVDIRSKFRLRYYNDDIDRISLEKKSKVNGMTKKESCLVSQEECRMLMRGIIPAAHSDMPDMKVKLLTQMQLRRMLPKAIVTYDRIPYVYHVGNVRITIDHNITASDDVEGFLNKNYRERPVLDIGRSILEVKWDDILPGYIKQVLQMDQLQWTSFSKYFYSRKYNTDGGMI